MSIGNDTVNAGGVVPSAVTADPPDATPTVRVWDPFVRVFHWGLVALFVLAFATGDKVEQLHIAAGYAIAAFVALRIVWGFIGSRHARFGDFVQSPRVVIAYLRDAIRLRAPRYLGHNPAGGAMVILLLGMLVAIATTGFMMTTDRFWGVEWVEHLHEGLAKAMLILIGLHVAGVLWTSMDHGENLVKALITGRKRAS